MAHDATHRRLRCGCLGLDCDDDDHLGLAHAQLNGSVATGDGNEVRAVMVLSITAARLGRSPSVAGARSRSARRGS